MAVLLRAEVGCEIRHLPDGWAAFELVDGHGFGDRPPQLAACAGDGIVRGFGCVAFFGSLVTRVGDVEPVAVGTAGHARVGALSVERVVAEDERVADGETLCLGRSSRRRG
jgi:hypothetical protein